MIFVLACWRNDPRRNKRSCNTGKTLLKTLRDAISLLWMVARRNPVAIDFLRTEVETASVFARIAAAAEDEEKKLRNRQHALRAYETLLHFVNQFALTTDEQAELRKKLAELRLQLVELGENL